MILGSGHGLGLAVFPLAAAVIAATFAGLLVKGLLRRWRWHEVAWLLALAMFAAASAAMFFGVVRGWRPADFRVYWLFGAVLNVPFLLVGEVYLLAPRRWMGHLSLVLLLAGSAFAGWKVWAAPVHVDPLAASLPLGKDVFGDGSLPYRLAQFYSLPAYFLLKLGDVHLPRFFRRQWRRGSYLLTELGSHRFSPLGFLHVTVDAKPLGGRTGGVVAPAA